MTKIELKLKALTERSKVLPFMWIMERKTIRKALLDGGSELLSCIDFKNYGQLPEDLKG